MACLTGSRPYTPAVAHEHLTETTVGRRVVHEGRFITFRIDTIHDPDGRPHTREIVEHPGAAAILPLDGDDLLLVRQYRTPAGEALLEIPAGTLDRAPDGTTESPDVCAARELAEETGHSAMDWRKLGRFWTAPGFATEEMHLYLARGLTPVDAYEGPEPDERLDLVRLPWREAAELAEGGEIRDAKSLVGIFWLERLSARGEL
jgi:ADP-ribose pyrophosphatase